MTRDLAIVLRVVPYEERHLMVTAITEHHGKVTGAARNAIQSRRFGGSLQPFAASEWAFQPSDTHEVVRLDEAVIRRSFEGLRKHFELLSLASAWTEILLKVAPERQAAPDLFKLHSNALAAAEDLASQEGAIPKRVLFGLLNVYLAKLLQWNGTQPQLLRCEICERSVTELQPHEEVGFSLMRAAWACPNCRGKQPREESDRILPIEQAALGEFLFALTNPIRKAPEVLQADEAQERQLLRLLIALLMYHVPGLDRSPLKSLRFLLPEQEIYGLG